METRAKVGDVLSGRYELRELLGAGGLGRVFKAWDRERRQTLALKLFDVASPPADAFRRYAEALRSAAAVRHPALALPQPFTATSAPRFVVGELLRGSDLEAVRTREGRLHWPRAAEIAGACADALAAVHAATGRAHRALKPGNVWIGETSQVRVLDFGVAELAVTAVAPRARDLFVEYRAPEQIEEAPGDARSDVYTLAVLLFELATGVHPFTGPSAFKAAHRALHPVALDTSGLPAQARPLLTRALARRPDERFADAREFLRALTVVRQAVGNAVPRFERRVAPVQAAEDEEDEAPVPDLTTQLRLPVIRLQPAEKPNPPTTPTAEPTGQPAADEPPLLGTAEAQRAGVGPTTTPKEATNQVPRRAEASRPREEVASREPVRPKAAVESTERVPQTADDAPEPTMALPHLPHRDERRDATLADDAAPEPTMALPPLPRRDDRRDATLADDAAPEPTMALPQPPRRGDQHDDRPDAMLADDAAPEPTMALPHLPRRDVQRDAPLDAAPEPTIASPPLPRRGERRDAPLADAAPEPIAGQPPLPRRDAELDEDAATTVLSAARLQQALSELRASGREVPGDLSIETSSQPADSTLALPESDLKAASKATHSSSPPDAAVALRALARQAAHDSSPPDATVAVLNTRQRPADTTLDLPDTDLRPKDATQEAGTRFIHGTVALYGPRRAAGEPARDDRTAAAPQPDSSAGAEARGPEPRGPEPRISPRMQVTLAIVTATLLLAALAALLVR